MLYVDYLGNNTVRLGDAAGGGTYQKLFTASALTARCAEKVGDDTTGRIWIQDGENEVDVLCNEEVSNITFNGTVYSDCGALVMAFNAAVAEETLVTTTSTTAVPTTTTTVPVTTTTTSV
jgi:hypothetical protein